MKGFYIIFFFIFTNAWSQQTISGKVVDSKNKPIDKANVFIDGTYDGATTAADGTFSFETSESGTQVLKITALLYDTASINIDVLNYKNQTIVLKDAEGTLDTVVINAGTFEAGDKSKSAVLKPLDIVTTAGSAGDIVGALLTLPGTQTVGESGRLFIRGGEANETQTFVDGIRVAQPYGAAANNLPARGRFSPFLFKGISFSTGGYSAEYGEALSSVLLLNTTDMPTEEQTDISIMTVGLGLSNTQKWKKSAFTFNTSYINLQPYQWIAPQDVDWNKPYQSLSGEAVYRHEFENGLLKVYGAFDAAQLDLNQFDINTSGLSRFALKNDNFYGNASYDGALNNGWRIFSGLSFGYNTNKIDLNFGNVTNIERAYHAKLRFKKRFSSTHKLTFGAEAFRTNFSELFEDLASGDFPLQYELDILSAFAEYDYTVTKDLAFKFGVRGSRNALLNSNFVDPRVSLAYKISKNGTLSAAYGIFRQAAPADLLKFENKLGNEKSTHYLLNYEYRKNNQLFRAEVYNKEYDQLVTFSGNQAQFGETFSNSGFGMARGVDLLWRDNHNIKNLEYWVSYSYIDTERLYRGFPSEVTPSFVAKHTASIVTKYWVQSLKSQIGLTHTFNSGRPYNDPNETAFMNQKTKYFQNLSLGWAYLMNPQMIIYFSAQNLLGAQNVFGYQFASNPDENGQYARRAIRPAADKFFFVGFFWTISSDKSKNQLDNL